MAERRSKKSAKVARRAARRVVAKTAKPRRSPAKSGPRPGPLPGGKRAGHKPTKEIAGAAKDNSLRRTPDSASLKTDPRFRELDDSKTASKIRFSATLFRPAATPKPVSWTFLALSKEASAKLPSRGMTSVEGTFNGRPFRATLDPDGIGGHWLKVDRKLREAVGAEAGDVVTLVIAPAAEEPEPRMPADLRKALAAAPKARELWSDITPAARRDFIHWITSPKRPETRVKRIVTACDMLAKGKRRPCCFDRSGMFSQSLSCPVADDRSTDTKG